MSERAVVRGSVRAVRTFRLLDDGRLAPVTRRPAWTDGVNTARCHVIDYRFAGPRPEGAGQHEAPAAGCTCGFWGYGNLQALRESGLDQQGMVVAVVSCHGTVVPATLGLRAQFAVIEAVWLGPRVDDDAHGRVARLYPHAATYRSLPAMLAEHPLSTLPTYALPSEPTRAAVLAPLAAALAWWLATMAVLLLGLVGSPVQPASPTTDVGTSALVNAPVTVAMVTTVAGVLWPRRWQWVAVALALQTALLVLGTAVLEPWQVHLQLVAATGAGLLQVAVRAVLARRQLPRRADR